MDPGNIEATLEDLRGVVADLHTRLMAANVALRSLLLNDPDAARKVLLYASAAEVGSVHHRMTAPELTAFVAQCHRLAGNGQS